MFDAAWPDKRCISMSSRDIQSSGADALWLALTLPRRLLNLPQRGCGCVLCRRIWYRDWTGCTDRYRQSRGPRGNRCKLFCKSPMLARDLSGGFRGRKVIQAQLRWRNGPGPSTASLQVKSQQQAKLLMKDALHRSGKRRLIPQLRTQSLKVRAGSDVGCKYH